MIGFHYFTLYKAKYTEQIERYSQVDTLLRVSIDTMLKVSLNETNTAEFSDFRSAAGPFLELTMEQDDPKFFRYSPIPELTLEKSGTSVITDATST